MDEESFEYHLQELRKRLLHSLGFIVSFSALGFYFSDEMLAWLQTDLGYTLNALTAYEVFYTQLMIALLVGFFLGLPFFAYQLLKFMEPGLKEKEYLVIRNYLPFSFILFTAGAVFSYNFIVKASLSFFNSITQSSSVEAIWGLQNTLGFALKLSAFTGVAFQLPIISLVLAKAGFLTSEKMKKYRAYFFVTLLILSAVATPPDIISQILVTLPVMVLYELSIWLVSAKEKV